MKICVADPAKGTQFFNSNSQNLRRAFWPSPEDNSRLFPSFPDFPVAPLVGELGADVEGEEEEGRPLGPRVHQAVGEDVALSTIH